MIIERKDFYKSVKANKYGIINRPVGKDIIRIENNLQYTQECGNSLLYDVFLKDKKVDIKNIKITSMYRCKALNNLIGGSKTSDHMEGKAFDFYIIGWTLKNICKEIAKKYYIKYDQLVLSKRNVHLSFEMNGLLCKNEFKVYEKGEYIKYDINNYFKLN